MNQPIELCIYRMGRWEIHSMYPIGEGDKAVSDAIRYKQEKAYQGIAVLNEETGDVLYAYKKGDNRTISFREVHQDLKRYKAPDSNASNFRIRTAPAKLLRAPPATPTAAIPKQALSDKFITQFLVALFLGVLLFLAMLNLLHDFKSAVFGASITTILALLYLNLVNADPSGLTRQLVHELAPRRKPVRRRPRPLPSAPLQEASHLEAVTKPTEKDKDVLHFFDEFIDESIALMWSDNEQVMKNQSHFALILCCAGAAEYFHNSRDANRKMLLQHAAARIAASQVALPQGSIMETYRNILEYLAYPQYSLMYDMGYQFARHRFERTMEPLPLNKIYAIWMKNNTEAISQEDDKTAAILFTDIVDFTASHQEYGDKWMRDVLRIHNEAVRDSIAHFGGREIKHTGDGIMASFSNAEIALNAAQEMQSRIETANITHPDRAFHIRVGISAGKPIHIDGDLFGTPVNKAARVMSFAKAQEIALSDDAYPHLHPGKFFFDVRENVPLKGFDGTHTVYITSPRVKENAEALANEAEPLERVIS